MRKCPLCAEEIQDQAVKCKHCGSILVSDEWRSFCEGYLKMPAEWQQAKWESLSETRKAILRAALEEVGQRPPSPAAQTKTTSNSLASTSSSGGFFTKLANGDFGLAKTYWLYGVAVGLVVSVVTEAITSFGALAVLFLLYTAYMVPVYVGIWRASNKYAGPRAWAVLAKIGTVVGVLWVLLGWVGIVTALSGGP